jgi:hypothetical protein
MEILIPTNSSLLRSLAFISPVRDDLFVEINHKQKNEPSRGDLFVNVVQPELHRDKICNYNVITF